jgi:hypothetical protein
MCYLDDSGSDDESPIFTIGGVIVHQDLYSDFSTEWKNTLPTEGAIKTDGQN